MTLTIYTADNPFWDTIIGRFTEATYYHFAQYHITANEGYTPLLLSFSQSEDSPIAALPILIRPIAGTPYTDATSVYGYVGWLFAQACTPQQRQQIAHHLSAFSKSHRIVSFFSRLNPFSQYPEPLPCGTIHQLNPIIIINLTQYPDKASTLLKRTIRRFSTISHTIHQGCPLDIPVFSQLYHQTMDRHNALPRYYFPDSYFYSLLSNTNKADLFLLYIDNIPAAAAIFLHHNHTIYYHLGATSTAHLHTSPLKQLLHHCSIHYRQQGATHLNLGGGYNGALNDTLFQFKQQFSPERSIFSVWQWIARPEIYNKLCTNSSKTNYFPRYRAK